MRVCLSMKCLSFSASHVSCAPVISTTLRRSRCTALKWFRIDFCPTWSRSLAMTVVEKLDYPKPRYTHATRSGQGDLTDGEDGRRLLGLGVLRRPKQHQPGGFGGMVGRVRFELRRRHQADLGTMGSRIRRIKDRGQVHVLPPELETIPG